MFSERLKREVSELNKRTSNVNSIPVLKKVVMALKEDMTKLTQVIEKFNSSECNAKGEEAARSQTVLKKLPLNTDKEVEKYLGDPAYRYICLGGTFAFMATNFFLFFSQCLRAQVPAADM